LQGALLVGQGHIAVLLHPVCQVTPVLDALLLSLLLPLFLTGYVGVWIGPTLWWRRGRLSQNARRRDLRTLAPERVRRRGGKRKDQRRGNAWPDWKMLSHDIYCKFLMEVTGP